MKILIVEDEIETRDFLKVSFEAESFAVDATADGEKGSYLARTNEYDLIILDNSLPKKTGRMICKEVRSAGKNVPILMLSIVKDTPTKVSLFECGADDYMTKPFSFEELMARTMAILRRPREAQENILQVGDLVLDTQRQTVVRGKKGIYLTRKEFSLLEYLMKHKGKVVSRGLIMEHVWNTDADPFSNTIEAHILNLRKKLRQRNKKELIHNIPGRGYKIEYRG